MIQKQINVMCYSIFYEKFYQIYHIVVHHYLEKQISDRNFDILGYI